MKVFIILFLINSTLTLYSMKYKVNEFNNIIIYSQKGIQKEIIQDFKNYFDISYDIIGKDLDYTDVKPKVYVYKSYEDLYNDLFNNWNYPMWMKTYRSIPRMNKNYEMWSVQTPDIQLMAHEYTHRIIEQIAGLGTQVNFKWFDEGVADYEGVKALFILYPEIALKIKKDYINKTIDFYKNDDLVKIKNMTTEEQWVEGIKLYQNKYYLQSYTMVNFLIEESGLKKVKDVLELVQRGNNFDSSFHKIYGITTEEFEIRFIKYLKKQ